MALLIKEWLRNPKSPQKSKLKQKIIWLIILEIYMLLQLQSLCFKVCTNLQVMDNLTSLNSQLHRSIRLNLLIPILSKSISKFLNQIHPAVLLNNHKLLNMMPSACFKINNLISLSNKSNSKNTVLPFSHLHQNKYNRILLKVSTFLHTNLNK